MLKHVLKILFALPLLVVIAFLALVNVNLHHKPNIRIVEGDTIDCDLVHELRGLKASINNGGDEDMQHLYPEGFVFLNAIYGLAWCNFIKQLDPVSEYFQEGKSEIDRSWRKIDSDQGRSPFDEDLPLAYGSFYTGWSNYLLGRKLGLESENQRDLHQVLYFTEQCIRIDSALAKGTYPPTYSGTAWPADVLMCVASLAVHDKLFTPKYSTTIQEWLQQVKLRLDPQGLVPHSARPSDGKLSEIARGSSQSLMLIFLYEIDKDFAREQFAIYRKHFVDTTMGLTGVREYPKKVFGLGDVDSGPLLLGYGAAATIVGMQTLSLYEDVAISMRIKHLVESFGLSYDDGDQKQYLFGLLPIADAFIAWGHSAMNVDDAIDPSFTSFHFWSVLIAFVLSIFFWLLVKPKKPSSKDSLIVPW